LPTPAVPRLRIVALIAAHLLTPACSDQPSDREGVVEIDYSADALAHRVKRRLDLLSAGVRLRGELAADQVWRNAMGYTFIAHHPREGEAGIAAARVRRGGIPISMRPPGIGRKRLGVCQIREGYWIVDLFSSLDEYLASVVAPREMPGRRILRHLGIAREVSPGVDRLRMTPDEQVYWRELLPVVVANKGYGYLFVPSRRATVDSEEEATSDSLKVMGQRYELEETGDYLLVGKDRKGQVCRHVFTLGGRYLTTVIHYSAAEFDARQTLADLGLSYPEEQAEIQR